MKRDFLAELINLYLPFKTPLYITNAEIMEFFKANKKDMQSDDFIQIRDYFLTTLGARG